MSFGRRVAHILSGIAVILLGFAPTAASALPLRAGIEDFSFDSFDATYDLSVDANGRSHAEVTETLVARFPSSDQNHGIIRRIPVWFQDVNTHPVLQSVTDENGIDRNYELLDESDFLAIKSVPSDGSFVHGRQTYVFKYSLENVIGNYQDSTGYDEFYWDVNGTGWAQPFGVVKAKVILDNKLTNAYDENQVACYQGDYGSDNYCDDVLAGNESVITFAAHNLKANQTLTVSVPFQPGTVVHPNNSYFGNWLGWLHASATLLAIGTLGWAIWIRIKKLGDAEGRKFIVTEYLPPKGASLAQGALVSSSQSEWLPARITQLAIDGYLTITAPDGLFDAWQLDRTDKALPAADSPNSAGAQVAADLDVIFDGETSLRLGRRSVGFARRAERHKKARWKRLWTTALFRQVPWSEREYPIYGALGSGALAVLSGFGLISQGLGGVTPFWVTALAVAAAFGAYKFASRHPLSETGAELRDHLEGLSEFIELAEKDRIAFLQSPKGAEKVGDIVKLYEPLLPWAILFGQEDEWSKVLNKAYASSGYSPVWMVGNPGMDFSHNFSSFGNAMTNASSAGGAGGSGSAGGGGGGGGGGGA